MTSVQARTKEQSIDAADYLFRRLHQLGVRSFHNMIGEPGFVVLDYMPRRGLNWVGTMKKSGVGMFGSASDAQDTVLESATCPNRVFRLEPVANPVAGNQAPVTTSGVGGISLFNAITSTSPKRTAVVHLILHFTATPYWEGDMSRYRICDAEFDTSEALGTRTLYMADSSAHSTIAEQIDEALRQCWKKSIPVYLVLPADMTQVNIREKRLETPINRQGVMEGEDLEGWKPYRATLPPIQEVSFYGDRGNAELTLTRSFLMSVSSSNCQGAKAQVQRMMRRVSAQGETMTKKY